VARDNVDVIEGAWAAWGKGNIEAATSIVAPEGEIHAPDTLPWGGTYIGPEGFQAMLASLVSNFSQFKATPVKVLGADDDHVVVLAETRGRTKSGNPVEVNVVWVYRLRDGQVESAEAYTDTAAVLEKLADADG
jgi:ketosteroid isomerase-like protein